MISPVVHPISQVPEEVLSKGIAQKLSELLIHFLEIRSIMHNLGLKDPQLDLFIRELLQEWIDKIGYAPYKKSFVENIINRNIDLFRNIEYMIAIENLIDIISYYEIDPEAFNEEYVKNFILEEIEALGIKDLVDINDPIYVRYVAYAIYLLVISKLDL